MNQEFLIEKSHLVGRDRWWVCYQLMGKTVADFPDDGKPVIIEVINASVQNLI